MLAARIGRYVSSKQEGLISMGKSGESTVECLGVVRRSWPVRTVAGGLMAGESDLLLMPGDLVGCDSGGVHRVVKFERQSVEEDGVPVVLTADDLGGMFVPVAGRVLLVELFVVVLVVGVICAVVVGFGL